MNDLYIRGLYLKKNEIENINVYPFNLPIIKCLGNWSLRAKLPFLLVKMVQVNQH